MSAEDRKTAVLIGAGMVAGTHVAACAAAAGKVRLKGVLSKRNESASSLAKAVSLKTDEHIHVYDSVGDVATDADVDFVIITTPPNVREDIITPLAEAGKHILLEKPIGRTAEESRQIVQICQNAGVMLGVVFQHRTRIASRKAKELIDEGSMGKLAVVEINVPWWRDQDYYDESGRGTYARDGGGVLISQAIHTIDLALSLSGPVSSVLAMISTSTFHSMESEDFAVVGIEFTNGAVGSLVASTASFPGKPESITLHFEQASLHLEAGQLHVSLRDGSVETFGEQASTGGGADPMAFTHEWHQDILENFVDALSGKSTSFISGEQAMAAHEFIEATVRSAKSGSKYNLGI